MLLARFEPTLDSWRNEARRLLQSNARPEQIIWDSGEEQNLFYFESVNNSNNFTTEQPSFEAPKIVDPMTSAKAVFNVPKEFITLARFVSCNRDPQRWSLLYRILFRLKNETPHLLKIATDVDVQRAHQLMKSVTRDIHKMHAFVRFKHVHLNVEATNSEIYMAWHRPEHLTLKEGAPFFVRRFGDKPWCIFTPDLSALWDGRDLHYGAGLSQHRFTYKDDFDELWKTYYSSIFNPARIKIKAMKSEMATKYWSSLPEASLISELIRQAPAQLEKMAKNQNVMAVVPATSSLAELYRAGQSCQACPLYTQATHFVPGEGPANAWLMIVGEQPGDQEDQIGKPFVGPAGGILQGQLEQAGLVREEVYLTNAVKHFKFTREGKLRRHQKPSGSEMHACRPWLEEEIRKIKPRVIVALGATAGTSVLGRLPKVAQERGIIIKTSPLAEFVILSWHPAAILRASSEAEAQERKKQLAMDLALAQSLR